MNFVQAYLKVKFTAASGFDQSALSVFGLGNGIFPRCDPHMIDAVSPSVRHVPVQPLYGSPV